MNLGGLTVNRMVDRDTGLEIRKGDPVDGDPYYFDLTEVETEIKSKPGGIGKWAALNAIINAQNKRTGGQVSPFIVQKWLGHGPQ